MRAERYEDGQHHHYHGSNKIEHHDYGDDYLAFPSLSIPNSICMAATADRYRFAAAVVTGVF